MKIRLLFSLLIVSLLAGSVLGATSAFFSDTETSTGNVLQAGGFDLLINGQNNPVGIVSFDDLKPGDNYVATKSAKLVTNPGRVWLHLKDLQNGQGTQTEPEILEEEELGEPKSDIENYITYDLKVGDNVIIDLEDETLLPDAVSCWIPLGVLPGNEEVKIEQSFHFDSSVTNWAQGDMLTFTEEFWAVQDRNNNLEPPDTGSGRVWNDDKKRCVKDLTGSYDLVFTCTSGCSGDYPHVMDISSMDISTGDFVGTGFYNPNPAITWNLDGNNTGININFHIVYTGISPGYTVDSVGTDTGSGFVGTATSSSGQVFTWTLN